MAVLLVPLLATTRATSAFGASSITKEAGFAGGGHLHVALVIFCAKTVLVLVPVQAQVLVRVLVLALVLVPVLVPVPVPIPVPVPMPIPALVLVAAPALVLVPVPVLDASLEAAFSSFDEALVVPFLNFSSCPLGIFRCPEGLQGHGEIGQLKYY